MDLAKQIVEAIVAGSEDLFESPNDQENLHVTVRIARDFYNSLVDHGEIPPGFRSDQCHGYDPFRYGLVLRSPALAPQSILPELSGTLTLTGIGISPLYARTSCVGSSISRAGPIPAQQKSWHSF
jgi:hypothetical protein